MKSNQHASSITRFWSMIVLLAGLATAPVFAGLGPQYWLIERSARAKPATSSAKPERCSGCSGVKTAEVTVTKPAWANGRGPLVTTSSVQTQACSHCGSSIAGRTPEWPNGRGPLKPAVAPASTETPVAASASDRRG